MNTRALPSGFSASRDCEITDATLAGASRAGVLRSAKRRRTRTIIILATAAVFMAVATVRWPLRALWLITAIEHRTCALFPVAAGGDTSPPLLMAHRGYVADGTIIEDSAGSVAAAMATGFRAVELDVSFTADLVPIVFHDPWLSRVTNAYGAVSDTAWDTLRHIPLNDGQSIMTLARFWEEFAHRFDVVCIDVKSDDRRPGPSAKALAHAMPAHDLMPRTLVVGVPYATLAALRDLREDLGIGCERFGVIGNWLAGFDVVSANPRMRSPGQARLARLFGLTYMVWTLNNEQELKAARSAGADIVITDALTPARCEATSKQHWE